MPTVVLAVAALALGAGPAGAHGGDTGLVHGCIDDAGNVKIVAADASCKKNEVALDWARDGGAGGGTTYTAGEGLTLTANEFSVKDVPWGSLKDVPNGFADGEDNEGPELTWGNLTGIPSDLIDGDDDGSEELAVLLRTDDGDPNGFGDPVSFSRIKDLTSSVTGDGRITGAFVRDGSIEGQDIRNGTITASDLAGSDAGEIVVGAVTSEKIMDRTIQARDLASGVLDRFVTSTSVDLPAIEATHRAAVGVTLLGVRPNDIVVVSPPQSLHNGLVFAGSDVLEPDTVTLYIHNITGETINLNPQTWTVRHLRTSG